MKDTKKIKYNLIVGICGQAIALILGIIVPKLVLTNYGSEVNGLLSSVTNIYAYIAIVEAGVAAASCQALYKPIVENNRSVANSILSATNKYYHKTGIIYLLLILLFSIIYPLLIKTDIAIHTVILVILFNGLGNIINYFFHGKYLILLKADGKNYIRTGLDTFTNVFKQVSKIVLISLGYNVILVQFFAMLTSFAQMIYITFYIKKYYGWIDLSVNPNTKAISQSKNVFVHEINYLVTSNVDTVILTLFSTLKTVSVYSLYNLLFNTLNRLLRTLRDSFEFKIAHAFHKDKKFFIPLFKVFETYYITFTFSIFSIANFFILPFISLYTKGINDVNYIVKSLPILFVLINLLSAGRYPSDSIIHISGHFKETQRSAIIETAINILSSLALVHFFGIAGVLLGTIISSLYRTNYLIIYVNKKIIGRSPVETYFCWLLNFAVFVITVLINKYIGFNPKSYVQIIILCVPYSLCVFATHFLVVSVFIPQNFKYAMNIIKNIITNKRRRLS